MTLTLLRILRWPNLLIVAWVQAIVYFTLLDLSVSVVKIEDLILLILITVLLSAGGYVINDYYDTTTDQINRPRRWIAGNTWSLSSVHALYIVLLMAGGLLSVWLAFRLDLTPYIFLYPAAAAGLWYYSYGLKCRPIIGNIWVSLFCAGVILIVPLPDLLHSDMPDSVPSLWVYAAFAFLATWYREMIKDLEDITGDRHAGCDTFVVRYGFRAGVIFSVMLGLLLGAALVAWWSLQALLWPKVILLLLLGCVLYTLYLLITKSDRTACRQASQIMKGVMLAGTLVLLLQ